MPLYFQINIVPETRTVIRSRRSAEYTEQFARFLAEIVRIKLLDRIKKQDKEWKPLSKDYVTWKKAMGYSTKTWVRTGRLRRLIKVWKHQDTIYIGIKPHFLYSGTKNPEPVYKVGQHMEYGTKNMPARPLFRPVFADIKKNMKIYYKVFKKHYG